MFDFCLMRSLHVCNTIEDAFINLIQYGYDVVFSEIHLRAFSMIRTQFFVVLGNGYHCRYTAHNKLMRVEKMDEETGNVFLIMYLLQKSNSMGTTAVKLSSSPP